MVEENLKLMLVVDEQIRIVWNLHAKTYLTEICSESFSMQCLALTDLNRPDNTSTSSRSNAFLNLTHCSEFSAKQYMQFLFFWVKVC